VAISLVVFGVQHFLYGGFVAGLVPAWMPGRLFWAYFVGVAFLAAAVGILVELLARPAATMLGVMFFLFLVLLHIPRIVLHSHDGNEWTSGFVALAMCGGAWVLASASPLYERETADPFLKFGQYIFAMAFVAFGIQHFVYARLAVGLGPPWFPVRPLWASFWLPRARRSFSGKKRDLRPLSWERSSFSSSYCCTSLASARICTIRDHGLAVLKSWHWAQTLWSWPAP